MMAGIAVTAADPSGLWGTLKESMANARTVMGAAHDPSATGLVHAISGGLLPDSCVREDRDRKNPETIHHIRLSKSRIGPSIARFAALRQRGRVYGRDSQRPRTEYLSSERSGL
jgi:hypothetical protein